MLQTMMAPASMIPTWKLAFVVDARKTVITQENHELDAGRTYSGITTAGRSQSYVGCVAKELQYNALAVRGYKIEARTTPSASATVSQNTWNSRYSAALWKPWTRCPTRSTTPWWPHMRDPTYLRSAVA